MKVLFSIVFIITFISCIREDNPISNDNGTDPVFPITCDSLEEVSGKIVYSTKKDGLYQIFTMNDDGTNIQQITHSKNHGSYMASWSPDGTKIVYVADTLSTTAGQPIFFMNSDGSDNKPMYHQDGNKWPQYGYWPKWLPDGSKIFFFYCPGCEFYIKNYGIYYYDFLLNKITKIFEDENLHGFSSISSDSKRIIIMYGENFENRKLYTISMNGEWFAQLLPDDRQSTAGIWSNDGNLVAFRSDLKLHIFDIAQNEIFPVELDFGDEYLYSIFGWSAHNQFLFILSKKPAPNEDVTMYKFNICDLTYEKLMTDKYLYSADWIDVK